MNSIQDKKVSQKIEKPTEEVDLNTDTKQLISKNQRYARKDFLEVSLEKIKTSEQSEDDLKRVSYDASMQSSNNSEVAQDQN